MRPLTGHRGQLTGVTFSPDRRTLASVGTDGDAPALGRRQPPAAGPVMAPAPGALSGVALQPRRARRRTAGGDGMVRLWEGIQSKGRADMGAQVCGLVWDDLDAARLQSA